MPEVVEAVREHRKRRSCALPEPRRIVLRELTAAATTGRDLITRREAEALELLADGYSTREVA
jgi:DNA-binding NarL/FixJ family response regulator